MIDAIVALAADPTREEDLLAALAAHTDAVKSSAGKGDRSLVARAEAEVAADPAGCVAFDGRANATVRAAGREWAAGRFEVPMLWSLRDRAARARAKAEAPGDARCRLWVLDGEGAATDIAALQATAPEGCLFQAASQFNCLESPGPRVVPVARYLSDPTQGPRASVSAFPATLVRHYAAPSPDGRRFAQSTNGEQVDLLGEVCPMSVARVDNGYLHTECIYDDDALAEALTERFDAIKVGVHDDVEVALGYNWDGGVEGPRRVAQVFTSTLAGGGYSDRPVASGALKDVCRQLLRGAYLGTLLAAVALGRRVAVLTLIGGGVFGNPPALIWESILWALDEVDRVAPGPLDVLVNGRTLARAVPLDELAAAARARGGAAVTLARQTAVAGDPFFRVHR
ncbi:MAG: hypothetical protein U0324_01625 [Polyangiales bacterium]